MVIGGELFEPPALPVGMLAKLLIMPSTGLDADEAWCLICNPFHPNPGQV